MITLRNEIRETEFLFVRDRERWIAIKRNSHCFHPRVEESLPDFFSQFWTDPIQHFPGINRTVASDLVYSSRRYWRHEASVFAKENRPVHNAIDRGVFDWPAEDLVSGFAQANNRAEPSLRHTAMIFQNCD